MNDSQEQLCLQAALKKLLLPWLKFLFIFIVEKGLSNISLI